MTSAVPGWDAAVEAAERAFVARYCPWPVDDALWAKVKRGRNGDSVNTKDIHMTLAAALPLVLDALEAEIRAKVTYSDEEDDALDFVCRFVATYRKAIQ